MDAQARSAWLASLVPKKKPNTGRAVKNRIIRFLSVSQVKLFDPAGDTGCPRRWAFTYIDGIKEDETNKQKKGKEYAKELEVYLKLGEQVLSPVTLAGRHLLPKPGPDLEVEQPFGDIEQATLLREQLILARQLMDTARVKTLETQIRQVGGLTVSCIPFLGEPDVRHYRQEYVIPGGGIMREDPGMKVCEVIDHKTTTRIFDHTSRNGKFYAGYAKSPDAISRDTQMCGYIIDAIGKHPEITHGRLGHIYYQTGSSYAADKRSQLVPVEEIVKRWRRVETVVSDMEHAVATVSEARKFPFNTRACRSYNRDCPHMAKCDRPARSIYDILEISPGGMQSSVADVFAQAGSTKGEMQMDMFNMVNQNGVNAHTPVAPQLPSVPSVPAVPQLSDAERAAAVEAEKQRLIAQAQRHPLEGIDGYTVGQPCNGRGFYANSQGHGFIMVEPGHKCMACAQPMGVPHPSAVNPADGPVHDPAAAAAPLPAEAIAQMQNPQMQAQAQAHADGVAARAQAEAVAAAAGQPRKTSGKCTAGGKPMPITAAELKNRKTKCHECGKPMSIRDRDIIMPDCNAITVPGHIIPKTEDGAAAAATSTTAPAATPAVAPQAAPAVAQAPAVPPVSAAPAVPPVSAAPAVPSVAPVVAQAPVVPVQAPQLPVAPVVPAVAPQLPTVPPVAAPIVPSEPAVPPATPVAPVVMPHTVIAPIAPVAAAGGITLYIDINFEKGDKPTSLEPWYLDIVRSIEQKYNLGDIRMAPETCELAFGRWKAYLAIAVRANLPPPGEYALNGVAGNEVLNEIVNALMPACAKVRKGGR